MMFCFPQYRANHRGPHLPQYPATVMEGFVHQTYNTANIYLQPKHMSDVVLLARPRVACVYCIWLIWLLQDASVASTV
jgi:hypothetical protein